MAKQSEKQQEVEKILPGLPEGLDLEELRGDAGVGVSDMGVGDVALPYLTILQGLSPQVQPGHTAYIEGATASMLFNTVSQKIYDGRRDGLVFVPCSYERKLVEWVDRDKGGGWVADYHVDDPVRTRTKLNEKKKPVLPNGNLLVETAYHYGLFCEPDTGHWIQCVMPMKSTALKVNRRWNNELTTTRIPGTELIAPRWLYPYEIRTTMEAKNNNTWWQFDVQRIIDERGNPTPVSGSIYKQAKIFHQLVESGEIRRAAEVDPGVVDGEPSGEHVPF